MQTREERTQMTTGLHAHTHAHAGGADLARPVVAAVDATAASDAAVETAVALAAELEAPLVFVHVRRTPPAILGKPGYQRRLTASMARAREVLSRALRHAAAAGVRAEAEVLEGPAHRRLAEFVHDRDAR